MDSLHVLASYEIEDDGEEGSDDIEHLTLTDGRKLGVLSRVRSCGTLADRGAFLANGNFASIAIASPTISQIASRDLAWDLVNSVVARDDVSAALLRRALPSVAWLHLPTRARWMTSRAAAATAVRLMRSGSPAPSLAPWRIPEPLDAQVVEMIAALDWSRLADGLVKSATTPTERRIFN